MKWTLYTVFIPTLTLFFIWIVNFFFLCRYVKSRNDKQLRGDQNNTADCAPERFANNGQAIVPCGLVAWSLFNDTYKFSVKNKTVEVSKKDITWKSDREKKFSSKVYPKNFQAGGLIGGGKLNSSIPVHISSPNYYYYYFLNSPLCFFFLLYLVLEVNSFTCFAFNS